MVWYVYNKIIGTKHDLAAQRVPCERQMETSNISNMHFENDILFSHQFAGYRYITSITGYVFTIHDTGVSWSFTISPSTGIGGRIKSSHMNFLKCEWPLSVTGGSQKLYMYTAYSSDRNQELVSVAAASSYVTQNRAYGANHEHTYRNAFFSSAKSCARRELN